MKFLIFFLFVSVAAGQTASEYFDQARKAFENKDYALNVELLEKTIEAGSDHPTILYFLARGYALSGNQDAAILWLNKVADLGISCKPEEDANFASLQELPEFHLVVQKFQANLKPTQFSKIFLTFADKNFIPEGVAYDPLEKKFYFGDAAGSRISTYEDGVFEDFSKPQDGLWSVLGMKIDPSRRMLWAASSELSGEQNGHSGVFQYDLKRRTLINKYLLPGTDHGLGDLEIDSKGNVYTTDSKTPGLYFLKSGSEKLELLIGDEAFRSPQGLVLSADEKTLFIADYSRGIFGIDLASRKFWKLSRSEGTTTVAGIDGLYRHQNALVGTQNGFDPKRVLRIFISKDSQRIERVDVLESNHPVFPEPTLGVLVQDDLYYVGNSMIGPFLDDPKTELKPATILKLPL
jgi:hypothetical protein